MGRLGRAPARDRLYLEGGVSRPRHFEDCLHREVARARRYGNPVSLIVLGVDAVTERRPSNRQNRRELTEAVADLVRRHTRETDVVGRPTDDDVRVLLPETPVEAALALAERLRGAVEGRRIRRVAVRACAGVATYRPDADFGPDDLVFEAESALDTARRSGTDGVGVFQA